VQHIKKHTDNFSNICGQLNFSTNISRMRRYLVGVLFAFLCIVEAEGHCKKLTDHQLLKLLFKHDMTGVAPSIIGQYTFCLN